MKRVLISITTIAALSSFAIAGKDILPVKTEPVEIPEVKEKADLKLPLGLYLGGGLSYASTECKCKEITLSGNKKVTSSEGKTYGVNLRAGYDYNKFIGIEAKYLHTPWGDDGKALKHYGIYLKPNYAVNENIDVYGLLGYGKTKCEFQNISKKGFAWGLGGEYTINKKKNKNNGIGIYAEYLRPLKKSAPKEITTNVANVGIAYHY